MPLVLVHKAAKNRPKSKARGELLAESFEPRMRRAFRTNIASLLTDGQVNRLAGAVRDQDMATAMQIIPAHQDKRTNWQRLADSFERNYRDIISAAGHEAIAEGDLGFTFNLDQRHVVDWIDAKTDTLIRNISEDTRRNIQDVIRQGSLNGLTIEQQARLIRPMIGLTNPGAKAVQNRLQLHLDAGMDEDQAAAKAATYAGELLAQRAETIARTETITAQNYGKMQSFNQARDMGLLGDSPTKKWVGSEFESSEYGACEECARLNKSDPIPLDELFDGGDYDDVSAPPLHPRCRCTLSFDPGFGDDVEKAHHRSTWWRGLYADCVDAAGGARGQEEDEP